jgi:RNA polymerase sigma-70 factor (ECF subfamily)
MARDYSSEPESELIRLAQEGERGAFDVLVERYQKRVYSVAYGMVNDSEHALDVTQEAFVKAYQSISSFVGRSNFYTWLYRITFNSAIDFIRREQRDKSVSYEDGAKLDDSPVSGDALLRRLPSPDSAVRRSEIKDAVMKAVETLPEEQRAAILLREVHGLSYKEIADVLKCSKGTVMSRLHYARHKLQKLLKDL